MTNELEFLQSLRESELTQLVIIPLLEAMDFSEIRYTHGMLEHGKDVVFFEEHPLKKRQCHAAVVKHSSLSGSVSDSRSIREVYFQVKQAITEPFIDPSNGSEVKVDSVYVITPFVISQQTILSIRGELKDDGALVTFIDGATLHSHLKNKLPQLLSSLPNPDTRYLHALLRRFAAQPSLGNLGARGDMTLLQLYTGGDLSYTTPAAARLISFAAQPPVEERVSIALALSKHQYCVVIADVGAGKTSLLQRLVILAAQDESKSPLRGLIPLFIPLAGLSAESLQSESHLLEGIADFLRETEGVATFAWQSASRYAILLDGFDELPSDHDVVEKVVDKISAIAGAVLLTSRASRIPQVSPQFCYLRLNPFSDRNVVEFLERWFPTDVHRRNELWSRIRANSTLLQFCRSPLMLTLYAILASRPDIERLPIRRTDIYSQIVEMLIGGWDRSRRVMNNFATDLKRNILEQVAYVAHCAHRRIFGIREMRDACRQAGISDAEAHERLLEEIIYRGSIVRPTLRGEYEFVHLSFQEYFTAARLLRLSAVRFVQQNILDDWWRAPLTFYFGLTRTMDVISIPRRVMREKGVGLRLTEFLAEADFTGPASRARVEQVLAVEIARGRDLSDEEISGCGRIGDGVIDLLCRVMTEREFQPNLQEGLRYENWENPLRVMAFSGSERARTELYRRVEMLSTIRPRGVADILALSSPNIADMNGVNFLKEGSEILRKKIDDAVLSLEEIELTSVGIEVFRLELERLRARDSDGKWGVTLAPIEKKLESIRYFLDRGTIAAICKMPDRPLVERFRQIAGDMEFGLYQHVVMRVAGEFCGRVESAMGDRDMPEGRRIVRELKRLSSASAKAPNEVVSMLTRACAYIGEQSRANRKH